MSDDQVRTVDKDIKTGLWQNNLDGSFIKVRSVGLTVISYNDEGCEGVYDMGISVLLDNYQLREVDEPAPVVDNDKQDIREQGKAFITEQAKDLPEYLKQRVLDGLYYTFNDDTPAQTFGDIKWDKGVDEKCVAVAVCLTCDAKMPEGSYAFEAVNQGLGCPICNANAGKMRLIGIAGQERADKDTLASYMLDNLDGTWLRSSFADPLKEMLRVLGVDCSDNAKAVVSDDYGVTPRHMMQTLGTEWGRNLIDGDIWVKAFARLNAGKCVIVPDVRFNNEADLVREHGVLIHLVGRGGIEGNHVSENAIGFKPGDIVIDNSRDLEWLHGQVDSNAVLSIFISEAN